jgi:hypothetical protein
MSKKNKCRNKGKAVLVHIDRRKIETMSPGILVAVAEWKSPIKKATAQG